MESKLARHSTTPTVLVVDSKPLSLLATAGVLHHEGMRCVCAGSVNAVAKALHLETRDRDDGHRVDASHLVGRGPEQLERADDVGPMPTHAIDLPTHAIDLMVWDVGDDATGVLEMLAEIRSMRAHRDLPAILIADSDWAGLEKRVESIHVPTHCLYKPIGTASLIAISQQLLWVASLQTNHRRRGTRPHQMGWVTLD